MSRAVTLLTLLAGAALLAACSEKPQTAAGRKSDEKPWEGAQSSYTAAGWKSGDASSWEQQIRGRMQGQNDYSRAPAKP